MVLVFGIRKSVLRLCVSDVSLAFGCVLGASQGKDENIPFQLLCHSTDRAHKHRSFDAWPFSYTASVRCAVSVLWSICPGTYTKSEAVFCFG